MVQLRSILKVADNTGAKRLRLILVHGGSKRRFGHVGDIITASVTQADPNSAVKRPNGQGSYSSLPKRNGPS